MWDIHILYIILRYGECGVGHLIVGSESFENPRVRRMWGRCVVTVDDVDCREGSKFWNDSFPTHMITGSNDSVRQILQIAVNSNPFKSGSVLIKSFVAPFGDVGMWGLDGFQRRAHLANYCFWLSLIRPTSGCSCLHSSPLYIYISNTNAWSNYIRLRNLSFILVKNYFF